MLLYKYIVYQLVYNFFCINFYNILIHIYFVYIVYFYISLYIQFIFIYYDEREWGRRCPPSGVSGLRGENSFLRCCTWSSVRRGEGEKKSVFSSRKVREKVAVARFGFIWQLLSNHGVISLKRFISSFTTKMCN